MALSLHGMNTVDKAKHHNLIKILGNPA